MPYGFVYCLGNPAMPGLYKIGQTSRSPQQRAVDLSASTGVPQPFYVVGYIEIESPEWWERRFHQWLDQFRSNERREFFQCSLADIAPLFLKNQHASAKVDCDFTPGMYPVKISDLPDPYDAVRHWI
jgi:hypothetical protein